MTSSRSTAISSSSIANSKCIVGHTETHQSEITKSPSNDFFSDDENIDDLDDDDKEHDRNTVIHDRSHLNLSHNRRISAIQSNLHTDNVNIAVANLSTNPNNYNNYKEEKGTNHLRGSMYKRRGGFGRNADNKWVMRCFTLNGPILCYYEEAEFDQVVEPSNPRSLLNLQKTETIAEMHSKHKPGLPTDNLLTINIYNNIGKKKWEMCCTSKEQQLLWYNAINAYDGKAIFAYDARAIHGAGPVVNDTSDFIITAGNRSHSYDDADMLMDHQLTLPNIGSSEKDFSPRFTHFGGSSSLLMQDVEVFANAAAKATVNLIDERKTPLGYELSTKAGILMIVVMNISFHWIRNVSDTLFRNVLIFTNILFLYILIERDMGYRSKKTSPLKGPKARVAKEKKQKSSVRGTMISSSSPDAKKKVKPSVNLLNVGSTIPKETFKPHSYGSSDARLFNLRIGPNYKRNKLKAPSGPALYELYSMDFVYGDTALNQTADKFRIPSIAGVSDVSTGHAHIPPMFIVNTWLPGEEPTIFGKNSKEEETYSIPMVFIITKDTLQQLSDLDNASPGVKLWSEWCLKAESDPEFRGRFKCMGVIEDIESTGVPKLILGYNGKPTLVTKSGGFNRHHNYIEFTINVGMWAFPARKGLHMLAPKFPDFIVNIGFTIEARSDEEMPEVLLGGCRIMNLNPDKAMVDGEDF